MKKITVFLFTALILINGLFGLVQKAGATITTTTFSYTGAQQVWIVPAGVTSVAVDAIGAMGYGASAFPGRVQTTLAVTPGDTLYVYVGGNGTSNSGYNGGAVTGAGNNGNIRGGGATDIRQGGSALANRVIVVGGSGSNSGNGGSGAAGGLGGGTTGGTGASGAGGTGGSGGTQSGGGTGGTVTDSSINGTPGTLGIGGIGGWYYAGGGGGGYWGGAGGANISVSSGIGGGGGGGSSYAGTGTSSTTYTQGYSGATGDGQVTLVYMAPPTIITPTQTSITGIGATLGGNVTATGDATITGRGVCVGTSSNPALGGNCFIVAGTTGVFTVVATGLSSGTLYHYRAYATNSIGTSYTADDMFTTLIVPTITSPTKTSITATTSVLGGNVTSDGGAAITNRGVCVGTSSNPAFGGTCFTASGTTGVFTANVTGLTLSTLYHYRAYAINSQGTSYTTDDTFTTTAAPTVVVSVEINVDSSSTTLNGTVNPNFLATSAWYLWGPSNVACGSLPNSTASQSMGSGSTNVALTAALSGFAPGVTYYYCAVASNTSGVTYSNVSSFVQTSGSGCPSVSLATDYTASSSCVFGNSTVDGVDRGTGTQNDGVLTISKGKTFTVGANQVVGFGLIYKPGATVVRLSGGSLRRGAIWISDTDGDGYPDNPGTQGQIVSVTQPSGYARRAVVGGYTSVDCAPNDATKFKNYISFTDADGDGYTTSTTQQLVCSGSTLSGATQSSSGSDCNDASSNTYQNISVATDADQDGYSTSLVSTQCVGTSTTASGRTYYKDASGNFAKIAAASIISPCDSNDANAGLTTCADTIASPDTGGGVGDGVAISLALDSSGFPVVSYYNQTNGDLKILHCGNANCTSGNSVTAPDTAGNVGLDTSLALDSSGFPVVSYQDITNGHLKILHCGNANCTSGNSVTTADTAVSVGFSTSLALDSSGFPVVSYQDSNNYHVKILHCGNANCTSGNSITTPDAASNTISTTTSLRLDSSGFPVVAYDSPTWNAGTGLHILHCGNVNCTSGNSITVPDAGVGGGYLSLALDSSGFPVVSYRDETSGNLKVLHCGNANCTSGNSIAIADAVCLVSSSIALDSSGFPIVGYKDCTNGNKEKVLHCGNANCTSGNILHFVDTVGYGGSESITFDSRGFPVMGYYDYTTGVGLKVILCGSVNCSAH